MDVCLSLFQVKSFLTAFCVTEFTVAEAKWFEEFFRANREGTECPLQRPQD